MPVQPHARTRQPFLTASAGWRWPKVTPAESERDEEVVSARAGASFQKQRHHALRVSA